MENKAGTLMSGVGAAAFLGLVLSGGGITGGTPGNLAKSTPAEPAVATNRAEATESHSDSGPWSAICGEYRSKFEHGTVHEEEPTGALAHGMPKGSHPESIEYTRHFRNSKGEKIDEKYQVRSHAVGDISKCVKDPERMKVLLATIPDPLASHFGMYFDRNIEALESAAGLSDYSISRFWLPWDSTDNPSTFGSDPARLAEWKEKLKQPGVLVFHTKDGDRLFIFLVGETPTSGIQRAQFANSLYYIRELLATQAEQVSKQKQVKGGKATTIWKPQPEPAILSIAGPHFSASLLGMAEVLLENKSSSPCVATSLHMISPDVSSKLQIQAFTDALFGKGRSPSWFANPLCEYKMANVDDYSTRAKFEDLSSWFVSLAPTDEREINEAFRRLYRIGYCPKDVASLAEDESAYSVDGFESEQKDRNKDFKDFPGCGNEGRISLRLTFPRDLSTLRNKTDSMAPSGTEINGVKLPLWSVPVTLGESSHMVQEDSPHTFAADQEAARIDHALQGVVASLRQHQIRAVIINPSNDLDAVFLLEYFKRALPNLRFVVLQADEFEIGRQQNVELTGTMVITGLPLSRDLTQEYIGPHDLSEYFEHKYFGSSDTEGTHLAAGMLIQGTSLWREAVSGPAEECAMESVVGRSEFLMMNSTVQDDPVYPCIHAPKGALSLKPGIGRGVPRSWFLTLLAIAVAVSIHLVSHCRAGVFPFFGAKEEWPVRFSYPGPCGDQEAKRIAMLLTLDYQYLVLTFASWTTGWHIPFEGGGWFLQWAVMPLLLFLCVAVAVSLICRGIPCKQFGHFRGPALASTVYTVITLVMWSWVIWRFPAGGIKGREFNALRIAFLPEGVSPFTPLLMITVAYIVYASVELNGIDWAARRHVRLDSKLGFDLDVLHQELQDELTPFSNSINVRYIALLAFGGAVACGAVFHLNNSLNGFDGRFFRLWLIWGGVGLCLVLIGFTVLRAWSLWRQLGKLLHRLQLTALRDAFGKLHEQDLPKLRIWDLGRRDQDLTIHTKTMQSLTELVGKDKARSARVALTRIRFDHAMNRQQSTAAADTVSRGLNLMMPEALEFLDGVPAGWNRIGMEKQRYLALRFVALIRYTLLNIRNLYTFVVYGFACLVVCVATYPFEGKSNLSALLTTVFVFILTSVGVMFVQIQKDSILSLIEGSGAGEVSYGELFKHLVSIGGVPALIVLATQFPSIAEVILSWAKPGLDLMK